MLIFLFSIVVLTIVSDQITKWLALEFLKEIETFPIIEDVLHLTYHENRGAAFGILDDNRWVFLSISTITIIGIIFYLIKYPPKNMWFGLGLSFILGGGIGNMIDRIFLGYVIDFVDFRLINFAIFNVADSFVCVGAVLVLIFVFFCSEESKKKVKGAENEEDRTDN